MLSVCLLSGVTARLAGFINSHIANASYENPDGNKGNTDLTSQKKSITIQEFNPTNTVTISNQLKMCDTFSNNYLCF
jgi:hypothetical protein